MIYILASTYSGSSFLLELELTDINKEIKKIKMDSGFKLWIFTIIPKWQGKICSLLEVDLPKGMEPLNFHNITERLGSVIEVHNGSI